MNFLNSAEITILDVIQENLTSPLLDKIMLFFTYLCEYGLVSIICALVLLGIARTRKIGLTLVFSLLLGFVIGNIVLKPCISRIRPYDVNTAINLIVDKQSDYSFPSGHTLAAFETAFSVFWWNKKIGRYLIATACAVGFSRLYLYVHYPTDVLAGAFLGIAFSYVAYKAIKQ